MKLLLFFITFSQCTLWAYDESKVSSCLNAITAAHKKSSLPQTFAFTKDKIIITESNGTIEIYSPSGLAKFDSNNNCKSIPADSNEPKKYIQDGIKNLLMRLTIPSARTALGADHEIDPTLLATAQKACAEISDELKKYVDEYLLGKGRAPLKPPTPLNPSNSNGTDSKN